MALKNKLAGERSVISRRSSLYPSAFSRLAKPPDRLFVIGNVNALEEGLAIVGARFATPYGLGCAEKFGRIAAENGITIISGGAKGCDSAAHRSALSAGGKTVVFLGGGCDELYPKENAPLFQEIIDGGGAIVSENEWDEAPKPYHFRERNRLIASLAKATLIVEAGLPSGTFSTADEAITAGREVLVIPGAITSARSHGANRLIYQGAIPIIDEDTFDDQIKQIFEIMICEKIAESGGGKRRRGESLEDVLFESICASPTTLESLLSQVDGKRKSPDNMNWLMKWLSDMQRQGKISRYPDGTYGPIVN